MLQEAANGPLEGALHTVRSSRTRRGLQQIPGFVCTAAMDRFDAAGLFQPASAPSSACPARHNELGSCMSEFFALPTLPKQVRRYGRPGACCSLRKPNTGCLQDKTDDALLAEGVLQQQPQHAQMGCRTTRVFPCSGCCDTGNVTAPCDCDAFLDSGGACPQYAGYPLPPWPAGALPPQGFVMPRRAEALPSPAKVGTLKSSDAARALDVNHF